MDTRIPKTNFLVRVVFYIFLVTPLVSSAAINRGIQSENFNVTCQGAGKVVNDPADVNSLRVVNIIFRHGDRTPIYVWPTDPYNNLMFWPEGWGALTALGKEQLFVFGEYLRHRYGSWIAKQFTPQTAYVVSSDVDRTIMSGNAAVSGLFSSTSNNIFQEKGYQQQFVPVHTIPQDIDNKILFSAVCSRYNDYLKNLVKSEGDLLFNSANQELYSYLSEKTGLNVTDYNSVYSIYDTLFIETCHNLPLPQWTKSVFPDKMKSSVVRYFQAQTATDEMRRLFTGPLWTNILSNIEKAPAFVGKASFSSNSTSVNINAPPPPVPNFYMFSGHDNTIAGLLDSVGALDQLGYYTEIPQYSSSLLLEVHEKGNSGKFYVKLFLRNDLSQKAIEMKLNCPSNPCSYPDFLQIVEKYRMTQAEWDVICSGHKEANKR